MKKLRDIFANDLAEALGKQGYSITKRTGKHIRFSKIYPEGEHHLTIPVHNIMKSGVLDKVLIDLSEEFKLSREELLKKLYD